MNISPSRISNLVEIKQNDTSRILYDDLTINGTKLNLSGSSVNLVWRNPRDGSSSRKVATVASPPESGSVYYALTPTDVATAGSFILEWEVIFNDTTELSVPTSGYIKLSILPDLYPV